MYQSIMFHLNQFALNQQKLIKLATAHKNRYDLLFLIFGSYDQGL